MVHAMGRAFAHEDAAQTHELTSALGHLLDRIGAASNMSSSDRSWFEMSSDEVDEMLGIHRLVEPGIAESVVDDEEPEVTEQTADVSPDGLDRLRRDRIFEPTIDLRALGLSVAIPTVAALVVAGLVWMTLGSPETSPIAEVSQRAISTTVASTVATTEPPVLSDASVASRAKARLGDLGITGAVVDVTDGVLSIDGVAPLGELGDGYFALQDRIEQAMVEIGASGVHVHLELRGDAETLRRSLGATLSVSPITFDSGVSEVTDAHRATLDRLAEAITAQPGLPVIVAGTTDISGSAETNEELARARAATVVAELVARGIPSNRLQIVSYGELFADGANGERTVILEVGA